jgi:parallel beta-helix repeat protein
MTALPDATHMRNNMKSLISTLCLLLVPSAVWGATYYVRADGNDLCDGLSDSSDARPASCSWKTLSKVTATSFSPGDTVKFRRGDAWNERLGLSSSGAPGLPITYTSYGSGEKPTFYGTTPVANTGWIDDGGGKYYKDIGSTVVIALYEDGKGIPQATATDLSTPPSGPRWYISGTVLYYAPSFGSPADHTLNRLLLSTGIYTTTWPRAYVVLDGLRLWHSACFYMPTSSATGGGGWHDITIQNFEFKDAPCGIFSYQRAGNSIQNITVQNNTFSDMGINAEFYSDSSGAANDGIYFGHNTITNSNRTTSGEYWMQSGDRDGVGFQNISNTTIEHNDISGGAKADGGITVWIDWRLTVPFTGNVIRYNHLHDLDGRGIGWDAGDSPASPHSVDIYYNVVAGFARVVGGGGIRLNSRQAATGSTVSNNVIYDGDYGLYLYTGPDYYRVRNNIVSNMRLALVRADVALGNNLLSNNLYAEGNVGAPFSIKGLAATWPQWSSGYGEIGSLTSDPLFVNPGTDFRLQARSPAINAGAAVGLVTDYVGSPICGVPNIGAYEVGYSVRLPQN